MTNYEKLVEALRYCADNDFCNDCPIFETCVWMKHGGTTLVAAAIEALQAEVQFYDALAEEWKSLAENKERLLGLYRAEQAKHFYSAMDDNGRIIESPCACLDIPVFSDCSENPNS